MSVSPFMDNIGTSTFRRARTVITNQSPFSGKVKRSGLLDWRWQLKFDYLPMKRPQAAPLLAAIAAQDEGVGSFLAFDPDYGIPRSLNFSHGNVANPFGAPQTGTTVRTSGWPPSTLLARAADKVGIRIGSSDQMFVVPVDTYSDGAGNCFIPLDAPMRGSPIDAAGVIFDWAASSLGIPCRLVSYDVQTQPGGIYSISVSGEEIV